MGPSPGTTASGAFCSPISSCPANGQWTYPLAQESPALPRVHTCLQHFLLQKCKSEMPMCVLNVCMYIPTYYLGAEEPLRLEMVSPMY